MAAGRIEPRFGLEVFFNQGGNITIKQIGGEYEEESMVIVHPDDVPRLIELLVEAQQEALSPELPDDGSE